MNTDKTLISNTSIMRSFVLIGVLIVLSACERHTSQNVRVNSNLVLGSVTIKQYERSPLAAIAEFATTVPVKVTLTIKGQDNNDITHIFSEYSTNHVIPLLGLYANYINIIELQLESVDKQKETITIQVPTEKLPDGFPTITVIKNELSGPNDEMFVLPLAKVIGGINDDQMALAVDRYGKVRWYYKGQFNLILKQLSNDDFIILKYPAIRNFLQVLRNKTFGFFLPVDSNKALPEKTEKSSSNIFSQMWSFFKKELLDKYFPSSSLMEIDLFGREITQWNTGTILHHDLTVLPNGNLLALTQDYDTFEDVLIEIDCNTKKILDKWDFREILDIRREPQPKMIEKNDWLHLNTVIYDEKDSSIIISARNQSAIVKLEKRSKKIRWILANHERWGTQLHEYLLKPIGKNFEWPWGQHAPIIEKNSGAGKLRLLVYDNGNDRGYLAPLPPSKSYTRAVEYEIDDSSKTVSQIWQYGKERGSELFTPFGGSAVNYSDTVLICFGGISRDLEGKSAIPWSAAKGIRVYTKNMARIIEVTKDSKPKVLMDIEIKDPNPKSYIGYECYRSYELSFY